jgi:1,4-alpha-glucan branching enzyme
VDPNNDVRVQDRWGVRVSRLELPAARRPTSYPVVRDDDVVEFRFLAETGKTVTIVGSFNGWDPFMTRMTESETGVYTRRLRLAPGTHRYYFMVDGVRIPDPQNEEQQWNTDGKIVSVVQLP